MVNQIVGNKALRFSSANWELDFDKCANEHLLDIHLCRNPGITAEILRDYVTTNNYALKIIPTDQLGINGGEEENRTTMQLLALDEIDFTGFESTYSIPLNSFVCNFHLSTFMFQLKRFSYQKVA